jgi:glycosyltransferase involved in cell wall biosynthesis
VEQVGVHGRPDRPLLLTVSRLAPEKNVGFLADVLRALPGTRLAVVGDGPQRAELERRFAGLDATFVGYLKGEELAAAYASADAFVYASEMETLGNVVLEAMAAGCPVVAPGAGGIPSLLTHGETGFLYPAGDLPSAADHARSLLRDPELRTRVVRAARRAVEGQNWEQSVRRVRQVYAEAICAGTGRAAARLTWPGRLAGSTNRTLVWLFRSMPSRDHRPRRNGRAGVA